MTIITMPDGQSVDFGDMPPDQIKALIRQKYPDRYPATPPDGAAPAATQAPYSGAIIPASKDEQGNVSFDPEAGITGFLGKFHRAMPWGGNDPSAVGINPREGSIDPNAAVQWGQGASILSPLSAASRGGLTWAGRPKPPPKTTAKVPAGKELNLTGDFGFNLARQMDVRYHLGAVQNMAMKLRSQLHAQGYKNRKHNAKSTLAEIKDILKPHEAGTYTTIDDLHAIRRSLDKIPRTIENNQPNPDYAASRIVVRAIDDFITRPDPQAVMAGPAAAAGDVWKQAMGNIAAGKRSDRLVDKPFSLEERTNRRLNPLSSGSADKKIRDRVGALLDNPDTRAGFTKEEIALLESVKDGTAPRNVISFIGNLMGDKAAAATIGAVAAGGTFGGIPGAVAAAVPGGVVLGARGIGNMVTRKSLNAAAEKVRQRSPLYEERVADAPLAQPGRGPALRSAPLQATRAVITQPPQMTKEQFEEYLRQKYARDQGA